MLNFGLTKNSRYLNYTGYQYLSLVFGQKTQYPYPEYLAGDKKKHILVDKEIYLSLKWKNRKETENPIRYHYI